MISRNSMNSFELLSCSGRLFSNCLLHSRFYNPSVVTQSRTINNGMDLEYFKVGQDMQQLPAYFEYSLSKIFTHMMNKGQVKIKVATSHKIAKDTI
jgi:hypothetical protein